MLTQLPQAAGLMPIDLATTPKRYLRVPDLAEATDVPPRTVRHHIAKGSIRVVKIGRLVRVPIEEACRWAGVTRDFSIGIDGHDEH